MLNLQQLETKSLKELNEYKSKAEARKAELEKLKQKGGNAWTDKLQDELNDLVLHLVDVDELIEKKTKEEAAKVEVEKPAAEKSGYVPKKGTEKLVHLSIVRGHRFNPHTGKPEAEPHKQMFTFSEWQLFKNNFKSLGYTIVGVLHDPYNEAAEFVTKQ